MVGKERILELNLFVVFECGFILIFNCEEWKKGGNIFMGILLDGFRLGIIIYRVLSWRNMGYWVGLELLYIRGFLF